MTKTEAHALVWSKPMRDLVREWQISEPALRGICVRAGIPIPPRGHWNRRDPHDPSHVVPLPPRGLGESNRVYFGTRQHRFQRDPEEIPAVPLPTFDESIEVAGARVARSVRPVPARPRHVHPLAEAMLGDLEEQLQPRTGYRPSEHLDERAERRRIAIANAVFLGLQP